MFSAADSNPWTTPTVVVPLVASLLALGGVVWSNLWSARQSRAADEARHKSTLEAEDRRHAHALEAEDRRHANTLRQLTHSTVVTKTTELYAQIDAVRSRLAQAANGVGNSMHSIFAWNKNGQDALAKYVKALAEFQRMHDRIALTASIEVAAACEIAYFQGFLLENHLYSAEPRLLGPEGEKFLDQGRHEKQELDARIEELLDRMRAELRGSP